MSSSPEDQGGLLGETQLQVTKWLSATNGWEAWRQLNLSFLSRLLTSLLQISLDDEQPASCLQSLAWKERVVEHQKLYDTSLNMLAIETCQREQEELGEHNRVDFQENSLQQEQEQDKPDKLVEGGQRGAYRPQPTAQRGKGEHQLPDSAQRACRDKPEETRGKGQESHPSFKRELEHRGKQGEAYRPQPQAYKGKGKHAQLPTQELWCSYCWKKGHTAQACWWNTSAQQQKHQQKNTWRSQRRKEAASKRQWRPIFC